MMKHRVYAVLSLLLALLAALSSCGKSAQADAESALIPYREMTYIRPDLDEMEALFFRTRELALRAAKKDKSALEEELERCWDSYDHFDTMHTLISLRSDGDQSDDALWEENGFCWESSVLVEQWLDELLVACAASAAEVDGGLLAGYTAEDAPLSSRAKTLMEEENRLVEDYWSAHQPETFVWQGQEVDAYDLFSDPALSDEDYWLARDAYDRQVNEACAPMYIQLVKTRNALAGELGYASYEDYCYASYGRDYSPAMANRFLQDVAAQAAPYSAALMKSDPYREVVYEQVDEDDLLWVMEETAQRIGGATANAFQVLRDYGLYDLRVSDTKATGAYTTYLQDYQAPFCFVGAVGDTDDILSFSHEFGHFADAYFNYNTTDNLDLAETYSQAMSHFAVLCCRDLLEDESWRALVLVHLLSTVDVFTTQAAYAAFESEVYRLAEDELTPGRLNALMADCMGRFGGDVYAGDDSAALYWTQVEHLFEMPFYVVSYVVSGDAALQLLALAQEDFSRAAQVYEDLLDWTEDAFLSQLQRVGLESPFAPGRAEKDLALAMAVRSGK